jgi:hypothetical protein
MLVNPALLPGSAALMGWLLASDYAQHYREAIGGHAARHGELAGAVALGLLDREDEETAEWIFVESLPEVPYDDPAWDREDVFLDAGMLADGTHPWPIPTTGDDDRTEPDGPEDGDRSIPADAVLVPPDLEAIAAALKPIAGGAPDDDAPEFIPTAADWEDYRNHFDEVEVRYGYE